MEDKIVRAARSPEKQTIALKMRRVMTPAEDVLWQRLRRSQLLGLHFRRQQVIEGFIVDFYCREARLVIECDGQVHERQSEYDKERDKVLAIHNLQILRLTNAQIETDTETVLAAIATAARASLSQHYQP